jgi:hypothetical protein
VSFSTCSDTNTCTRTASNSAVVTVAELESIPCCACISIEILPRANPRPNRVALFYSIAALIAALLDVTVLSICAWARKVLSAAVSCCCHAPKGPKRYLPCQKFLRGVLPTFFFSGIIYAPVTIVSLSLRPSFALFESTPNRACQ